MPAKYLVATVLAFAAVFANNYFAQAKPVKQAGHSKQSSLPRSLQWESSWKVAVEKSKATGKPIMLDFYTDWCHWCKRLDRDVYEHPAIINQLGSRMIFLKVNPERSEMEKNLAFRYKAGGFPTVVVLDSAKNEKARIEGYKPPEQFLVTILDAIR